ncbi:MAG TPA: chromosome segregation protein SMC [Candidatus Fimimorpha faecalis]|uniref:Chromosome partition protein Smc n=1 Tax=Candidatus Fimimorpha faecalis TaxID=2840824 RepID=A0A9D1EDD3_9FIRM|nr:chromosome segregation protein SMC [Candidatus Fimimorpha faecalis]
MYLKSIEVNGFKSFANKIKLEFHNGITCIVGPNGSGKSNVADAVRWVLGEQSAKQLRGSNMQDVIFSGTESRKPQSFAYVAITLDNSDHQLNIDYTEVTVARRVYRSGESEYLLNGHACRLKDVNELFYDTGIGKEGYSIIGQGQIEKILSSKPEDRRELFDEAAGIVKFKRRKAIALKKLENERANMVRVTDILAELEKQVGPLEKQSEAAKQFLKLKEELKNYDVHIYILERETITQILTDLQEKIKIAETEFNEVSSKNETLKAQYVSIETKIEQMELHLEAKKAEFNHTKVQIGDIQGQINVLQEQIDNEKRNQETISERMKAVEAEIQQRELQKTELVQRQNEMNRELYDCENAKEKAKAELEALDQKMQEYRQTMEEKKGTIITLLNEKASYVAQEQRFQTMMEQNQIRKAELNQKLLKNKTEETAQQQLLEQCQKELEHFNTQKNQYEQDKKMFAVKLEELEAVFQKNQTQFIAKQQRYHAVHTRAESLKNLAERYEGYGTSIKRIMEQRSNRTGIHGVVADILKVKKQYEVAIETALGGSIQNVVTDTEQTAKQLIEYLKKNKFGRATFLPLNGISVRGSFTQKEALKETGVIGLASSLVEADECYRTLIEYLLGRVLVVDQIDHALAVARKYQYSIRIVTLEGELLNAGGSMTGGAFKNASNLLGRNREIEELEAEEKKLAKSLSDLQKTQKDCENKIAEIRLQKKQLEDAEQEIRLQITRIGMSQKQAEEKQAEILAQQSDMVRESNQIEQLLLELKQNCAQLQQKVTAIDQENQKSESFVLEYQAMLEKEMKQREESAKMAETLSLQYANLSQSHQFINENMQRIHREMEKFQEERSTLQHRIGQSERIVEEKIRETKTMNDQIEQQKQKEDLLEKEIAVAAEKKENFVHRQKGFFDEREELSSKLAALDKELFRLNNQKEKQEERLDAQTSYLWNEYELMPSEAMQMRQEGYHNLTKLRKFANERKDQIKALGNVNVNAIEDYKEVLERYTFMKTQYEDLVQAERALVQVIEELDVGMRRQFQEKFEEIKVEFDQVFKELFGGGKGTLELIEGEDIIEAGIRIISQPPGKKLQNMMQLSGGEKALTAISLLFAIQNLKPSPFCLLDEIEAALDDSNVGRFSNYLHKLTKNTQFIIITHRRGTMVSADRLYGITMQEKGVSTLVSVNLIEQQLES